MHDLPARTLHCSSSLSWYLYPVSIRFLTIFLYTVLTVLVSDSSKYLFYSNYILLFLFTDVTVFSTLLKFLLIFLVFFPFLSCFLICFIYFINFRILCVSSFVNVCGYYSVDKLPLFTTLFASNMSIYLLASYLPALLFWC